MLRDDKAQAILTYLNSRRQEIIDFACELIATPSINPPGDERAVVAALQARLGKLGLDIGEILARTPERPNLISTRRGRRGTPRLILNGHTDTKPVGEADRKLWKTDPMKPTIVDGTLFGLGATDMKGGLAAIVYAAAAVQAVAGDVAGDLVLIFTANEEAPGEFGANWLVKNHDIKADFCLVAEPCGIHSEFENLPLSMRSTVLFRITLNGTQMHSSISDQFPSINASVKMAWVMWRMANELRLRYTPHPYYPKGPTINLGEIVKGGLFYGVYPGYAEFCSDIRLIPGMTRQGVIQDLEEFLSALRREDPELQIELDIIGGDRQQEWKWLRGDEPFVNHILDASEFVLGRRLALGGYPAYTDSFWFHSYAGIPTLPAFGPGLLPPAHGPNEWIATESIIQASKMYALAALEYLDEA